MGAEDGYGWLEGEYDRAVEKPRAGREGVQPGSAPTEPVRPVFQRILDRALGRRAE